MFNFFGLMNLILFLIDFLIYFKCLVLCLISYLSTYWCGESGIRTRDTLLAYTRFPGVPLQPLEHLSKKGDSFGKRAQITKKKLLTLLFLHKITEIIDYLLFQVQIIFKKTLFALKMSGFLIRKKQF